MFTVKVDIQRKGQERSYGPHVVEATLTYAAGDTARDLPYNDAEVKRHAQAFVGTFREGPGDGSMDSYYATKLARFERTDDGSDELTAVYALRLETPYTD